MTRNRLYLLIITITLVVLSLFSVVLQAQAPTENNQAIYLPFISGQPDSPAEQPVPEEIRYFPGELPPGYQPRGNPYETPPTPTPNPYEAKLLPRSAPVVQPTLQMIDMATDLPFHDKHQYIIKRANTGKTIVMLFPPEMTKAEFEATYLEEGDEFVISVSSSDSAIDRIPPGAIYQGQ